MKNSDFWNKKWGDSVRENDDARFMSGWGDRTFQEMLFSINDIAEKMKLSKGDILLNVGCGAGIFELAFTHWISEIYGIDYSKDMVAVAQQNTTNFRNVKIMSGNICDLPFKDNFFNKILVHGVLQYLNNLDEISVALSELNRVAKSDAIICLSLIPNAETKNQYLEGYHHMALSDSEIQKKIETNNKIIWFDRHELAHLVERAGMSVISFGTPVIPFQKKYYFDLIVIKE